MVHRPIRLQHLQFPNISRLLPPPSPSHLPPARLQPRHLRPPHRPPLNPPFSARHTASDLRPPAPRPLATRRNPLDRNPAHSNGIHTSPLLASPLPPPPLRPPRPSAQRRYPSRPNRDAANGVPPLPAPSRLRLAPGPKPRNREPAAERIRFAGRMVRERWGPGRPGWLRYTGIFESPEPRWVGFEV